MSSWRSLIKIKDFPENKTLKKVVLQLGSDSGNGY